MRIALLSLFRTCIVRRQCVRMYLACTKRLSNLLREATIKILIALPSVMCAIFPLKNKQIRFCEFWSRDLNFQRTKKKLIQDFIADVFCPTCPHEKCVFLSTYKTSSFYDCWKCKTCSKVRSIPFNYQKPTFMLFGCDRAHCFARRTGRDCGKENPSRPLKKFLRQSQSSTPKPEPKGKKHSLYAIIMSTLLCLIYSPKKNHSHSTFIHFQSTVKQQLRYDFLSLQPRWWLVSRLWTRFSYSDCKRSHSSVDNIFWGFSFGSLHFVVVSKTRLFQYSSNANCK